MSIKERESQAWRYIAKEFKRFKTSERSTPITEYGLCMSTQYFAFSEVFNKMHKRISKEAKKKRKPTSVYFWPTTHKFALHRARLAERFAREALL